MSSKCHRKLQEFAQIKVCRFFFVSFSGAAVGPRVFCTSPDHSSNTLIPYMWRKSLNWQRRRTSGFALMLKDAWVIGNKEYRKEHR